MSKRVKQYLMLLAALGVIAVALGGGSGTFASFNAEVANNDNVFATGTLFLHEQPVSGNLCRSEDDAGNANVSCDVLIDKSQLKAGDDTHADITLTNAGSINATGATLGVACDDTAKPTIATTTTAVTASTTYTHGSPLAITIPASGAGALDQTLVNGTQVDLTDGTTTVTLIVDDASDAAGSTTVNLTGTTGASVPSGTLDVQIHAFGAGGFCSAGGVQFYVQEMDSTFATAEACAVPAADVTCTAEDIATAVTDSPNDLTTNEWSGSSSTGALDAGTSRYYRVYVQIPAGVGVDNSTQNSQAKFDLDWKIAQ
ncbi:MAG TPA: hypothetical protein VHC01_02030 [Gaiellaceae bacterium]|jgi:predicted ribosomally synthesized peptide with SipW-like signal peptide|nr:hypothetical protein [Gaiellaceae bacterium]